MAVIIRKKRASQRADGQTDERNVDGELAPRSPLALRLRPPFILVPRCINLDQPIFLILLHTNICFSCEFRLGRTLEFMFVLQPHTTWNM